MFKKVLSLLVVSAILITSLGMVAFASGGASAKVALSFTVSDAISSPDGSALFLLARGEKKVYKVDTSDFSMKSVSFDLVPEKIVLSNGKLFVALCTQPHSSYWWDEDQNGAFAIVDADKLTIDAIRNIDIDPCDIAVTNDGFVCIAGGSGQWTDFRVYNQEGNLTGTSSGFRERSSIVHNPVLDKVYASEYDLIAFTLDANGKVANKYYDWLSDYSAGRTMRIAPDGKHILTNSGTIFTCNSIQAEDIKFKTTLNKNWVDLAFSDDGKDFYTVTVGSSYPYASNKEIYAYDYATFEGTATYETQGYAQNIFVKGDTLTAISKETSDGSVYFIETIDLTSPKTTIETTVSTKALSYENGRALLSAKTNSKTVFSGNMMYIADSTESAVFAIDTTALTETKITFPNVPTTVYAKNDEVFVGFGNNGTIAVLDASTYAVKERIVLGATYYDMIVGNDGYFYTVGYNDAQSFSRTSGQLVSTRSIYPHGGKPIEVHPTANKFYWPTIGISPQDINAIAYDKGIAASYELPYHGDYSLGSRVKISPDGANIFTNAGSVFRSSTVHSEDMRYKNKFVPFTDLTFDLANNQMFASQSTNGAYYGSDAKANLGVYNYSTYERTGFIKTAFNVENMTVNNGNIIALSADSKGYYYSNNEKDFYLEKLNATAVLQVIPEKITVNTADTLFLAKTGYQNITSTVYFNDGTNKVITNTAEYKSSNEAVATVSSAGRIQAIDRGYTKITIESDGITKAIDVYVDADVDSISVEGHNISFTPSKTSYTIMLPAGTTTAPIINVTANEGFEVKTTYPTSLPGTATVTVGANGAVRKTYGIYFDKQRETAAPVTANIEGGAVEEGTQIILSSATANADIYYSLNGYNYRRYTAPIVVNYETTIKAYATRSDMNNSEVSTFIYTIKPKLTTNVIVSDAAGQRGKDVEVQVVIENNPGMAAFAFNIDFDNTLISPLSVTAGDILADGVFFSNVDETQAPGQLKMLKMISVSYSKDINVTENGVLFTIKFHIEDDVRGNEIPISIYYLDGQVIDEEYQPIPILTQDGIVKLKPRPGSGDIFGDGLIDVKDGLKMTQYFAGQNVVFTEDELFAADVNCDRVLDIKDGLRIAQYLAGWDVTLGE